MTKVDWKDLREGERVRMTFEGVVDKNGTIKCPGNVTFCSWLDYATITRIEPEPAMTGEELDKARADEVMRRANSDEYVGVHTFRWHADEALRLAREGWTPPPPVDEAVLACREICAMESDCISVKASYRSGAYDAKPRMRAALAAYRAGKAAK